MLKNHFNIFKCIIIIIIIIIIILRNKIQMIIKLS